MSESAELPFLVSGESCDDMGQIKAVLAEAGQSFTFVDRWGTTNVAFSPDKYAGLIILGSSDPRYSAPSKKFQSDRERLHAAMESNKPVLGICYGAELMAAYLLRLKRKQRGRLEEMPDKSHAGMIVKLELRGEGLSDPVVESFHGSRLAIMSHVDCFQEPRGGIGLAWSTGETFKHCEAFRVGPPAKAVYGFQFHPEPNEQMLQKWPFKEEPDAEQLSAAVKTGRKVLSAWIKRAIAQ